MATASQKLLEIFPEKGWTITRENGAYWLRDPQRTVRAIDNSEIEIMDTLWFFLKQRLIIAAAKERKSRS